MEVFTSDTEAEVKAQIIQSFGSISAPLRIVCATVAFGMGVDTPDICRIIHQMAYRNGNLTATVLLKVSKYNHYYYKDILGYIKNTTECRRDILFQDTDNYVYIGMGKKCLCCDICKSQCNCGFCETFT